MQDFAAPLVMLLVFVIALIALLLRYGNSGENHVRTEHVGKKKRGFTKNCKISHINFVSIFHSEG